MGMFGWSLPPGVTSLPDEEEEQPIELAQDSTLRGIGRRGHGLNGKDADLDEGGQNVVKQAWWFSDGTIQITGRRYAAIVPYEEATESQLELATEEVIAEGYPGEWDGDYWVLGEDYELQITHEWDDSLSDEDNIDAAVQAVAAAIVADSKQFELAMASLSREVEKVTRGDSTQEPDACA